MTMTVVVTNNVPDRYRGFLASCMCEIAPGVFTAPRMSKGVRERIWLVLERWYPLGAPYSVLMTWADPKAAGGQRIRTLGLPQYEVLPLFAAQVVRRDLTAEEVRSLTKTDESPVPF